MYLLYYKLFLILNYLNFKCFLFALVPIAHTPFANRNWQKQKQNVDASYSNSKRTKFTHRKLFCFNPNAVIHIKLINEFYFIRSE